MATASTIENHQRVTENPKPAPVIPIKVGLFGGQGSGKTTTAQLLAVALSKEMHGGAPVWVTDTEPGWQFGKRKIFAVEGVELVQRTIPTFKAMLTDLRDAERAGACVWAIDVLTVPWTELMNSFKAKNNGDIPINVWGDLKAMWNEYVTSFLNSKMHCIALGRLGDEREDIQDDKTGRMKTIKTGTKFKAGGGESFGYEPHLLIEMSLERKAKRKAGSRLEGEGRMVHRGDVLKDRTWELNGKILRFSDKDGYQPGGYRGVWEAIKPHFLEVQATMAHVEIGTGHSSQSLISENGNSEYYERKQRRDVLVAELEAAIQLLWGGQGQAEKRMRMLVAEHVFGVRTKDAWEKLALDKVERGVRIMQAFEQRVKRDGMPTTELDMLAHLDIDIKEHDEGAADPF
jgi:hypothetical protein